MLKINPVGEPTSVPFEIMPERIEFKNPSSSMTVIFHSVREIRMSHYVWKISLFDGDDEITKAHSFEDQDFFLPIYYSSFLRSYYAPWGYQGNILCLYFVTPELDIVTKFYSIQSKSYVVPPLPNTTTLLCSSSSSDVLTISHEPLNSAWSPFMISLDGKIRHRFPFSGTPLELFVTWIKPFPQHLVIFYDSDEKSTTLYHYEEITDECFKKIDLEPKKFAPFDEDRMVKTEVDKTSPSALKSLAFGDFLNKWDEIGFEFNTNTLILRVVRPSSDPFMEDGMEFVNIQKFEVKLELQYVTE